MIRATAFAFLLAIAAVATAKSSSYKVQMTPGSIPACPPSYPNCPLIQQ